jgi:hypothetical protein
MTVMALRAPARGGPETLHGAPGKTVIVVS